MDFGEIALPEGRKAAKHPSPLTGTATLPCVARWNCQGCAQDGQQRTELLAEQSGHRSWRGSPALGTIAIPQTQGSSWGQQGLMAITIFFINIRPQTS